MSLSSAIAGAPTYAQAAKFNAKVSRFAVDPVRARVYATSPDQNAVLVFDSTELKLLQTIPIGSSPRGCSISPDGTKLYVANSGSTTAGIGVVNLDTLQTLSPISTPAQPGDVVAGNGGILYATPAQTSGPLMRIDSATNTSTTFGPFGYANGFLQISPDRNTLYFTNVGVSPATLTSYDVSTSTPTQKQTRGYNNGGGDSKDLKLSHDGTFLAAPSGAGNSNSTPYGTNIVPASDLNGVIGTLSVGAYPGPIAFDQTDKVAYQTRSGSSGLVEVFDLQNYTAIAQFTWGSGTAAATDVAVSNDNSYLFLAYSDFSGVSQVLVFDISATGDVGTAANISTRGVVPDSSSVMIAGFIIQGGAQKKVIIRGLGPSLASSGVANALQDPTLELHDANGRVLVSNDNWQSSQSTEISGTGIPPQDPRESAIVTTLDPGTYTAQLRGNSGSNGSGFGVGLVEVYDLDSQPSITRLANISTRGDVLLGDDALIGGFIMINKPTNIVVRAIGPSLTAQGVADALADPMLELRDGNGGLIAANDNWRSSQQDAIMATGIAPTNDAESAILADLAPGNYTGVVRGVNNTTGIALVEVYSLTQ